MDLYPGSNWICWLSTLVLVDPKDPICYNKCIVINKEHKMYSILANPEKTQFQVIWHRKGQQQVVATFATFEEAVKRAWPKY